MADGSRFYTIRRGDRLGDVARRNGTTSEQLARINGIKNPSLIYPGQVLALSPEAVLKVEVLVLDKDHNPLPGLKVRIEHCGRVVERTSAKNGLVDGVATDSPDDLVKIHVQRADGSWKLVASVKSGFGTKRITLISPKIKIEARTQPHPQGDDGKPVRDEPKSTAPRTSTTRSAQSADSQKGWRPPMVWPEVKPSMATGVPQSLFATTLSQLGIKTESMAQKNGATTTRITNDQAGLDFLDTFNGEVLADADFKWAASELGVEEAVIRAINEIEAAGKGFEKLYGRMVPKILFERQWFHRQTNGVYTPDNLDISCPTGYYQKKTRYVPATRVITDASGKPRNVTYWRRYSKKKDFKRLGESKTGQQLFDEGLATKDTDQYLSSIGSYRRLLKAYRLDAEAALKSCSWGGFQIMGFHHGTMGYATAANFVKAMSRSEREQVIALVKFFKDVNPGLIPAMKRKDFAALAAGFNGESYKENSYDVKLRNAYGKWKGK